MKSNWDVLDVALALPDPYKTLNGQTKPIMKELGSRTYPRSWAQAKKLGFPTPKVAWMKGELAPWMERMLGSGSWSRAVLGVDLVDDLRLPADYELLWTLAGLEELLDLSFPGVPRSEIPLIPSEG